MKAKQIIIALLVLLFGFLIYYRITANKKIAAQSQQKDGKKNPVGVKGIIAQYSAFNNDLSIAGTLDANEQAEIHSEVSGIIKSIGFQEGVIVQQGQVLLRIVDNDLQAQLNQAIAKEDLAQKTEIRNKTLLEKEVISKEEYDIVYANWQTAKAQTQLIKAQIAKTVVTAPFSGKVGLRNVSPGSYITPASVITKIVKSNPLKLTFSIPEKYASKIGLNSIVNFKVTGLNDNFKARIYAIEPEIDMTSRTIKIRALVQENNPKLTAGMFAEVTLAINVEEKSVLVPTEAIVPMEYGKKIFIVKQGKATEQKVETFNRTDKDAVILSGVKEGDTIIVSGVMSLKDKMPVKVKLGN